MATESQMRAVRFHEYGPPSVLVVDEIDRPEPRAGEVLIRVHAAGVNPIDWKFRAGYLKDFMPLVLPHTPGLDVSGTVESLGEGVSDFAIGDRVFGRGTGTYAEFAVAPAGTIARIPDGVSFEHAAPLHVGGETAWVALFDTTSANVEDAVHDVDVVIDTVGGPVTAQSWNSLKPGGILVVVAGAPDTETATARGVRTSGVMHPPETRPVLEELGKLLVSGDLKPQLGPEFPLEEAARAHALSETGHGRGRILLKVVD